MFRAYQGNFTGGELSPEMLGQIGLNKYQTGLAQAVNVIVKPQGGVINRAGFEFIAEVKDSAKKTRLIPFQFNTEQTYILEFGDLYMRVFKDGGAILSSGSVYEITTPFTQNQVDRIVFAQEADVMYLVHEDHPPQKLSRLAEDNWTLASVSFQPSQTAPGTPTVTAETGSGNITYKYKVAAVSESGEESLPSAEGSVQNDLGVAGNKNKITWTSVAGAERYIVYKESNGAFGYIGGTEGLEFIDENITADLGDTPQKPRNPFDAINKYPRTVGFVEQRLAFASTKEEPQAVWLSQSGNYENFNISFPAKADDAVTFRIKSREVNEIRSIINYEGMMLFTSGGEWNVSGGRNSDKITPSSIQIRAQSHYGMSHVQPIVSGRELLTLDARGGIIRDFSYNANAGGFLGADLTIMARHLFEGKEIVSLAYAKTPNSVVLVVLDNGSLVSLTYQKEHDIWAWTKHESAGGFFEDVAVVDEDNDDRVYVIVKRKIQGTDRRYIERLHLRDFSDIKDAFFVDSGLTYNGAATDTLSGLSHLEGETVVALADGNVVKNLTVQSGTVTLPFGASKITVGLEYNSKITTLPIESSEVVLTGRKKTVKKVFIKIHKTRGLWIGGGAGQNEYKQRTQGFGQVIDAETGVIDVLPDANWNKEGQVEIEQKDPLPMEILAIAADIVYGA